MRQVGLDPLGLDLQEPAHHQALLQEPNLQGVWGQGAEAIQQPQGAEVTVEARAEAGAGAEADQDHLEKAMTWNQPKLSRPMVSLQMPAKTRMTRLRRKH